MNNENLLFKAMEFAIDAHGDQKRKYSGEPYWKHLSEVAGIVATVDNSDTTLCVAWLHDTLEDTKVTHEELITAFGGTIAYAVLLLSDLETGNRATRKQLSRERLSMQTDWVQNIKVADLISNTASIVEQDPEFAKIYLEEKRLLLEVLTRADRRLVDMCKQQVNKR